MCKKLHPPSLLLFFSFLFLSLSSHSQDKKLHLKISGSNIIETKIIDSISYLKKHNNYISIEKEVNSIQKNLFNKGYFDLSIYKKQKTSDSLYQYELSLNRKYDIIKVRYNSKKIKKNIIDPFLISLTDSTFTIATNNYPLLLNKLSKYYSNSGNPFNSITLENIKKKDDTISGILNVYKSKERSIDNVFIKGYTKFPKSYLKYYGKIKKGKKFNQDQIISKSEKLNNLSFVKNIKPPEILFTKDSTNLFFYLQKVPTNSFEGFLGFTNNSETNDLEFNGNVNLKLVNNLNYGEELKIIYKNDGREQQLFNINVSLPFLLKSPIGIKASLEIFRKDSSFVATKQGINLNYIINSKSEVSLGYKSITSSNLLNTQPSNSNIEDINSSFLTSNINYTIVGNSIITPIKTKISTINDIGTRKDNTESVTQFRTLTTLEQAFILNNRNTIYLNNITGFLSSKNVFDNELFRFGGINSIRGFEENSIQASLFNVLRSEYRYLLSPNLYVNSIIDYAYFEEKNTNITDNLTSIGFGLGLRNQTGLFKVIFANGKNSNQSFRFNNTKIHINFTAFF